MDAGWVKGVIVDIRFCTRPKLKTLILMTNIPFKTKYNEFIVYKKDLKHFKIGDEIKAWFSTAENIHWLGMLENINLSICPTSRCFSFLEEKWDNVSICPECYDIPDSCSIKRIERDLQVDKYASFKDSFLTEVYTIQLHDKEGNVYLSDTITPKHPFFSKFLLPERWYRVLAWNVYSYWRFISSADHSVNWKPGVWKQFIGLDILSISDIE